MVCRTDSANPRSTPEHVLMRSVGSGSGRSGFGFCWQPRQILVDELDGDRPFSYG